VGSLAGGGEQSQKEGVAYKSSMSAKVSASEGSLSEEEVAVLLQNGYIIEYI
jgi:hypothetical protein